MQVISLEIQDVKIIVPEVHKDHRGYLEIMFDEKSYQEMGICFSLKQINQGYSRKIHTIRGLHYQEGEYAQGKIVSANQGAFFSVAVDLRKESQTFGKWCGEILSLENQKVMYIPRGFAHGYMTLESDTILQYCVDNGFCATAAKSLRFDDPDIGIEWPAKVDTSTLTEKDIQAKWFKEVVK